MKEKIWAIPGFLGLPQDWNDLNLPSLSGIKLDSFTWESLWYWAKDFNKSIATQPLDSHILMGYSLGGRLALHAIIDQPTQWKAAIIVSAHPGLSSEIDKVKRFEQDQMWANRFKTEEWHNVMKDWNNQEIFQTGQSYFFRQEHDYQRHLLAQILIKGSLSQQSNLHFEIAKLPMPILWITGNKDQRYSQLARELKFKHPLSTWEMIPSAGHRVPWDQPSLYTSAVKNFLSKIE